MTNELKAKRSYYFRQFVARKDMYVCKRGEGPMVLTWAKARKMWAEATAKAHWHAFVDEA